MGLWSVIKLKQGNGENMRNCRKSYRKAWRIQENYQDNSILKKLLENRQLIRKSTNPEYSQNLKVGVKKKGVKL